MRQLLESLLIVTAIALCGIVLLQWKREFDLRRERQDFADRLSKEEQTSHGLRASLQRVEAEVIRLTDLRSELASTNQAVREEISQLKENLAKATAELARNDEQLEAYKLAVNTANENVKRQNQNIERQNADMRQLAQERNDAVQKHNALAKEYNALVEKWNKLQEDLAKADSRKARP